MEDIRQRIEVHLDISLAELKDELELPVCISALSKIIRHTPGLKFKKTLYAAEQNREDIIIKRQKWMSQQADLPPYSPDFNPIEMKWSKMKTYLRKVKAPTEKELETAIAEALNRITVSDIRAWIRGSGYSTQ